MDRLDAFVLGFVAGAIVCTVGWLLMLGSVRGGRALRRPVPAPESTTEASNA